jgi:uncharacterized protein
MLRPLLAAFLLAATPATVLAQATVPAPVPSPGTVPAPRPIPAPEVQHVQIPESHANAALEVLRLTGAVTPLENILPNLMRQVSQTLTSANLAIQADTARRQALDEVIRETEVTLREDHQRMIRQVAIIYAIRFPEPELRQIADFFRSPVGAKFVQQSQLIAQDSFGIAQQWASDIGPRVIERVRAEMRRRNMPL